MAAGNAFIHQARDRWSVFPAPEHVNELAVDDTTVWVATDDGVVRFESGSRRLSALSMDDGLPSQSITSVAFDDLYVWFGTNKGLARYRKHDRTIRVYDDESGLPHRAVNDILRMGRTVWVATRAGIAVYDPEVDGLRPYTTEEGLGSDFVEELYQLGDDLWCRTDQGLSRLQIDSKRFTNFSFADIGGEEVRLFMPDGENVWVGTEKGLSTFESSSDAFIPFPQQGALESLSIRGVEPFNDYVFIVTDIEVVQFNKRKSSFRRYTEEADGIVREAGAIGTTLTGGQLTVLFEGSVQVYEIARDLWIARGIAPTQKSDEGKDGTSWQAWTKLDGEVPIDVDMGKATDGRYGTAAAGFGVGYQFDDGSSFDLSGALDYGEVELDGLRDLGVKAEYLGTVGDIVREVKVEDALAVKTLEEGLESPVLLMGGRGRFASPGAEPTMSATVDVGVRRGLSDRNFFTGRRQEVYQLSHRYVLPGTERVYLDGELLTTGREYTIIYPAGQLAFLDPEKVDDLSIIEVEYEYDVLPKKGLGVISLLDLLPADNEVGAWVRSGEPTVISEESGLYAQIDGAAPKYIDRGWRRSVYVEYRQGSRTIALAIHDMETPTQAKDIYDYDLPAARESVGDRDNMVLDIGLATSYAAKSYGEAFYIELSIDEKSDPAKQSLKLFAIQVLDRGETAGEYTVDDFREIYSAARAAWSPARGVEFGARAVQIGGIDDDSVPLTRRRREQLNSVLDARYEQEIGQGGRLTAYAEGAASHGQRTGDRDGLATMGRLRLSHPLLEGTIEGRYHDPQYSTIGESSALAGVDGSTTTPGALKDDTRISATAYPTKWLPTSVFFSRREARLDLDDGSTGTSLVQHALGRVQLAHKKLPATSLQVGHTLVDDALGVETNRLKLVGEADYDFAEGILAPLGMRRFIVRGLYGFSTADSETEGLFTSGKRVEVSRLEAKLAPTSTETGYALFRSRVVRDQEDLGDEFDLAKRHWELNLGARSSVIPGVIPQVNYSLIFDQDKDPDDATLDALKSSNGTISGQLGIYPGEWHARLAPVVIDTRYSMGEEARSERRVGRALTREGLHRLHRVDNRMSYVGTGAWELELREIYEVSRDGETQEQDSQRMELRNRLVLRPTHASPITLRLDYVDEMSLNDLLVDSGIQRWGKQRIYEGALEWLMRWDRRWTTKVKTTYTVNDTLHQLQVDEVTGTGTLQDYTQQQVKPEIEVRFLMQRDSGAFFLVQRDRAFRMFGSRGAVESIGWDISLGVIWSEADNLYLDAEIAYRQTECLDHPCTPIKMLQPRILLTAKL